MSRRGVTCRVQHDQKRGSGNFSRRNTRESGMSTTLSCCLRGSWCGTGSCQPEGGTHFLSRCLASECCRHEALWIGGLAPRPATHRSTVKFQTVYIESRSTRRHGQLVPACPGGNASLRHARSPFTCLQVAESELRIGEKRGTELNTVIQMIRHSATFFSVVALQATFFGPGFYSSKMVALIL